MGNDISDYIDDYLEVNIHQETTQISTLSFRYDVTTNRVIEGVLVVGENDFGYKLEDFISDIGRNKFDTKKYKGCYLKSCDVDYDYFYPKWHLVFSIDHIVDYPPNFVVYPKPKTHFDDELFSI